MCCKHIPRGFVNSCSVQDVDEHVENLKLLWDARKKPFAPSSGPRFHSYFIQYQADVVCYHMRRDLRESAGLGSPPANFTTNASKYLNAAIKRKVNFKESDWPEFVSHIKQYIQSQREEVIRSLSGCGQYRLCPDVAHYGVPTQSWVKMTAEQRCEVVSAFEKTKLPRRAITQTEENVESSITSNMLSSKTEASLSICAQDSGIISIPLVTLTVMWNKASEMLSTENAITPAPVNDTKARTVLSRSQDVPHHIRSCFDGQYLCDNNCPQWMSSQICSHTIAVAEQNSELLKFLEWYVKVGQGPNLSFLGVSGLPKGNYSLRSGLVSIKATAESGSITQSPLLEVSGYQHPVSISCSAHSPTVSLPTIQHASQGSSLPNTRGLTVMLHGHIEQGHSVTLGPPPLISVTKQNVNPFYLKKLTGNIRICQGCRGSLRAADGSIPNPPFDIIIARLERDHFGIKVEPTRLLQELLLPITMLD